MNQNHERIFAFVGERPSPTAQQKGWRWEDGRLAAAQLFDALKACGHSPENHLFLNLFIDQADVINPKAVETILALTLDGAEIVGMGKKVQTALQQLDIQHLEIVHPAARGKIRGKKNYTRMIAKKLGRIRV